MAQDFEDGTPVSPAAPVGQTASGEDTATNQADPNTTVDISRGPTLGGDVQSGTIDMAVPGSGVSAAAIVSSNPFVDDEKAPAPTTSKTDPVVTDQAGTPTVDTMNTATTEVTDGVITEGGGRVTEGAGNSTLAGGITAPVASRASSGSDDQEGTKEENKAQDTNAWPLDSPVEPPPGVNRLLENGDEFNKVEANAKYIQNPNAAENITLGVVDKIKDKISQAENPNIKIDTSLIKLDAGLLAAGLAELEIERQKREQEEALKARAELDKIEAEKVAKAATEMAGAMMTQMLIGSGAQGNGQGPGALSLGSLLAKDNPLHKDNLPKMPPGVNPAEVSALLAFVNPGSLQAPGYGALGTGTNHGLGGTGLGQNQDGPSQIA